MSEFSARSTRVMTSPKEAEQSVTLTPRSVYLKWAFGSSCGMEIFGSEAILLLNKVSGFRTQRRLRTRLMSDLVLLCVGVCTAYYETIERPAGCPDQNQNMGACSKQEIFICNVLCSRSAAHLLVCEAPLYTQTHTQTETVP